MTDSDYGFYFEQAGLAAAQGAIAPAEQYFEGSRAEVSVVRETGQNSLDAAVGDGPVRMEFELGMMPTSAVPGIDGLREHLVQVVEATRDTQGHKRMLAALDLAQQPTVSVLRVSDYGTTGLGGSESLGDPRSRLSALTRGAGISANDGSRGGSFGIGSAVGPMASDLCTVFYTSMPRGDSDTVFAGYSRLASHVDAHAIRRVGDGFYTNLSVTNDFKYLRNPKAFGPFAPRTQAGTDIFIIGYRKADEDPQLHNIRDAFVDNFMMAIHEGKLEVAGKGVDDEWQLNAGTLERFAAARPDALAFYRAILDPKPIIETSKRFGELRLYINVDPSLPKSLHTITMRRPLMRIDTFRHTSIPAKYAAILVCADRRGNTLLRELEPPQHDSWDGGRAPDGKAAVTELKKFVREKLRDRVKESVGEIVEIKDLARFLPSDAFTVDDGPPVLPGLGDGETDEAATVQGDPASTAETRQQSRKQVPVTVKLPAKSTDREPAVKGKDASGAGKRHSGDPGIPGSGEPGEGRSRISRGQVRFRSWSAPSAIPGRAMLQVALTARQQALTGDIELITLGAGGAPEPDYDLPVLSARMVVDGTYKNVDWQGNVFRDVELLDGRTTRLEIEIESGHRYRLDVKE